MHAVKPLYFAVSLVLIVLPCAAQEHTAYPATGARAAASSSGLPNAGHLGTSSPTSKPSPNPQRPRSSNRYAYRYGAPYMLPYDNEYDQLDGHGTLDQAVADDPSDRRTAPTIFEHNGAPPVLRAAPSASRRPVAPASSPASDDANSAAAETVLVFRDGHQQEIGNYAITGTKLIVLGEKTEKIELTDVDLGATIKANADRGVEFKTPAQS